jgi:hypothetical protein
MNPQERVLAFIEDWHNAWNSAFKTPGIERASGEDWFEAERQVQIRHFLESSVRAPNSGGGYSPSHPEHQPGRDNIIKLRQQGDVAVVETEGFRRGSTKRLTYQEFELQLLDGDWRIAQVCRFDDPEGIRIFTDEQRQEILDRVSPTAALPSLKKGFDPNCQRLFEAGRDFVDYEEHYSISVDEFATLDLRSGIIGVRDWSWIPEKARPLTRSVPPGRYRVDVARTDWMPIALRIAFDSTQDATQWLPAMALDADSEWVGVDGGTVSVFDFADAALLDRRQQYRLGFYDRTFRESGKVRLPTTVGDGPPSLIEVRSGRGDGGYPCYWGISDAGKTASLVVDFLIACQWHYDKVTLPWSTDQIGRPLSDAKLEEYGLQLTIHPVEKPGGGLLVSGDVSRLHQARLLDSVGDLLLDTSKSGYSWTKSDRFYSIDPDDRQSSSGSIEVEISVGYSN